MINLMTNLYLQFNEAKRVLKERSTPSLIALHFWGEIYQKGILRYVFRVHAQFLETKVHFTDAITKASPLCFRKKRSA